MAGDDLRLDQSRGGPSGLFADKNAGTGKTVTVSGIALTGTDLDNYALASITATTTANIDPRALTVGAISAVNKTYDGSTTATLDTSNATLTGVLQGESVALDTSRASGQFDTKDVGQGKAVTVTDFALSGGADAANYRLADPTLMTTANIDPRALTVSGISAINKTYDGTTIATLDTGTHSLEGKVAGDELWLDESRGGPSGTFADKNVGTGKTVTISGIALGGADLGNYLLSSSTATTTAHIGKATLNIVANDATAVATDAAHPGGNGVHDSGFVDGEAALVPAGTLRRLPNPNTPPPAPAADSASVRLVTAALVPTDEPFDECAAQPGSVALANVSIVGCGMAMPRSAPTPQAKAN